MPNGEILDFQYDPATNLVQVGKKEEKAFKEVYSQAYNVNLSMAENMKQIYKVLAEKMNISFLYRMKLHMKTATSKQML